METKTILVLITVGIAAILNSSSAQTAYQTDGLASHNNCRASHYSTPMTLDTALNMAAQDCAVYYATKGMIDHLCKTDGAGENLYATWGGSGNPNLQDSVKSAVKAWYDENKTYNYDTPANSTGVTGHFTQVVWKASTTLGIGAATVNGYTAVVGKYKPQGNVLKGGTTDDVQKYEYYTQNVQRPS